jgi:SEC-C motif-containing protein
MAKVGRNTPCPCGSGKKFKHCHGGLSGPADDAAKSGQLFGMPFQDPVAEAIRQAQQGKGRPIVSGVVGEHRVVAVGTEIHWSKKWKTFADFLTDYMKFKMGADWAKLELESLSDDELLMVFCENIVANLQNKR